MEPERWQRMKGIFQHALELPPAARSAYLEQTCGGDTALYREIEELVGHHQRAGSFIEKPALGQARDIAEDTPALVGRSLGAYRVLRRIGSGGMGAVYLARRNDAQYQQQVAIKILKLGMDSEFLIARFRQERQILANLDHPSIARLLDGGTLEDGRPYLVMEYIEGEPISEYCDRRELSIHRRLELFRQVCAAVQYAHRNLVVHRDLKPSNILVTTGGVPKLLDFGTAKLLDAADPTTPATATGLRVLTPGYASPEQLRGEAITTACDVYALGVVLYELLTRRRLYSFQDPLSPEALRAACEETPPRPSAAIQRRELEGDLDNIVLMALRKEPERRYASVEQLSEDLRRHLANLPVIARPDTLVYRTGKFVRRHRAGLAATSLIFLILIGAVVTTTRQARRAERQQARAEEVSSFMTRMFEMVDPSASQGRDVTVREMLDRGAERIAGDLAGQPELQAELMNTMGYAYITQGILPEAIDLLEEALAIVPAGQLALEASIRNNLGKAWLAWAEHGRAEPFLRQALELRQRLYGPSHPLIAKSLDDLAECRYARGDFERARALYEQALAMYRTLPQAEEREIATTVNNLGATLLRRGEIEEAEKRLREALEIRLRVLGADHHDMANTLLNLGAALFARRHLGEAEEKLADGLAMEQRLHRDQDHPHVVDALKNLASVRNVPDRIAEAEPLLQESLEMGRRMWGPDHPRLAPILSDRAVLEENKGNAEAAVRLYRRALDLWHGAPELDRGEARQSLFFLARLLYKQGDFHAAALEYHRLLEAQRGILDPEDLDLARTRVGLGLSLLRSGDPEGALAHLQEALEVRRRKLPPGERAIATLEGRVGECLIALERYEDAEPLVLASYEALAERYGGDHARTRESRARIVALYQAWGRPEDEARYRRLALTETGVLPR